jgi:ribosomal protein L30/L7E
LNQASDSIERQEMTLIVLFTVFAVGLIAGLVLILRKAAFPKTCLPITATWIEEISVERYRPMMRVLDPADFEFVSAQPGTDRNAVRRLRRLRIRIFRRYLRDLNTDFACVCMAIKLILLQSSIDRPDLTSTLIRSQIAFGTEMVAIQARLVLYALGLRRVETKVLLNLFDAMRLELRSVALESAVWGA